MAPRPLFQPPPTAFGPVTGSGRTAQTLRAGFAPPPTRFGPTAPAAPAIQARRAGMSPPPTRFGSVIAQAILQGHGQFHQPRSGGGGRHSVIQRMDDQHDVPKILKFKSINNTCSKKDYSDLLREALEGSIKYLGIVIDILSGSDQSVISPLILKYFKTDASDSASMEVIISVLKLTKNGLEKPELIDIEIGYYNFASKGSKMGLAIGQLKNIQQAVRYMIHEGTHLFAKTTDNGGYVGNNGVCLMGEMQKATALQNADCMAVFVVLCVGLSLT